MTHLTADEITTLDEAWRTGSFAVVLDAIEAMVDAHRDEAVVMASLADTWGTTRIEDDPNDPDMVIVYLCYGGTNQTAFRQERKTLLWAKPLDAFIGYEEIP